MTIVSAILLGSLATAAQTNQASDVPTHAAFNYDANYANDRAEIENLSARYMIAMDDYDGDAYAATFTPDGVLVDALGVHRGRQQIYDRTATQVQTARSSKVPPGTTYRPRIQHNITNEVIEVNGDTATQVAYWIAFGNATPQKDTQILFMGHYFDHLVKVNGHWYFKQRQIFNESASSGGSQRKLFYPELGETDPTTNEAGPTTK
jgi:ketosteroid isomerase-like protein